MKYSMLDQGVLTLFELFLKIYTERDSHIQS